MGTNFYVAGHANDSSPKFHLGKRSAAGMYCWDCHKTLCKAGEARIHYTSGYGLFGNHDQEWHKACPNCGKKPVPEPIGSGAVGRELGFNTSPPQSKTGVASCSSFNWAMTQERFENVSKSLRKKPIEDEYGRKYTLEEFRQVLVECPVRYFSSIGKEFS
jgi:hypothetical protein